MQMEPMSLGSPPSSPGSPQVNPNYLPAFLMGDRQVQTPNRNNLSPTKNRSFGFKSPTTVTEQRALHNRLFTNQQSESPRLFNNQQSENSPFNISNVEKAGPPALGLFDSLETNEFVNSTRIDQYATPNKNFENIQSPIDRYPGTPQNYSRTLNDTLTDKPFPGTPNLNLHRNLNDSLSKSHPFRKQVDKADNLWVTVLGFPPHAASLILSQFAQFGTIIEKKYPPEGNWVHLKYSAQHEVARAMSFNGKLISNSIMVGVIPHMKPANPFAPAENKENNELTTENTVPQVTSPNRARSLTQPYTLPRSTEVLSPQNVPQKSTGLVTKAMEYVFGW